MPLHRFLVALLPKAYEAEEDRLRHSEKPLEGHTPGLPTGVPRVWEKQNGGDDRGAPRALLRQKMNTLSHRLKRLLLITLLAATAAAGQTKQLCVTIDDLPVVAYGITDTTYQRDIIAKLTHDLTRVHVPAVGFVNEQKLNDATGLSPFRVSLLEQWLDAGMELGNHTYSHPDINTISCAAYFTDVIRGETVTRDLLQRRGKTLRYFRHPFLYLGSTHEVADSLSNFLAGRGYTTAPVTIDNDDYMFAAMYHRAYQRQDTADVQKIGREYVAYLEKKLQYYERQSVKLFGRPIAQVLLIHASRLNADHIGQLLGMIAKNGYTFTDLATVLKDEAYRTPITVYKKYGISWLDRWAISAGKAGEFFKDEPDVPEYIRAGWR